MTLGTVRYTLRGDRLVAASFAMSKIFDRTAGYRDQ